MSKTIQDIVILGAGTAGIVAALTIRTKFPTVAIHLVRSQEIGIVGVGEGTTEHWKQFAEFVNIDPIEMIKETNATAKIGVLFKDWNGPEHQYVHSVDPAQELSLLNRHDIFNLIESQSEYQADGDNFELSPYFKNSFYPDRAPVTGDANWVNQFHFDTFKLNEYLIRKCIGRDIHIVNGTVQDVTLNEDGSVKGLVFDNGVELEGDFFIDSSGFKRVIANKLGVKWIPATQFLPMNKAITFPTEHAHQDSYEPYTTATSLSAGWSWKIPTQERYGNGYVFSDKFISSDEALNELNKSLGTNVEEFAREISFSAGYVDEFWKKNCICIGLAGSFAEPLEAQSIGFSWIQAKAFIDLLEPWTEEQLFVEKRYNSIILNSWSNLVDFVQLHYYTQRNDTPFWKAMSESKLCAGKDWVKHGSLEHIVPTMFNESTKEMFKCGHIVPDFFSGGTHGYDRYLMFRSASFYQVYSGLGLINKESIKDIINQNTALYLDSLVSAKNERNLSARITTSHRKAIELICGVV